MLRRPPTSTLFPYPTLFRSVLAPAAGLAIVPVLLLVGLTWRGQRALSGPPLLALAAGAIAVALSRSGRRSRSEEHTSELQSLRHLVCRLLLEKKKNHRKASITQNKKIYKRRTPSIYHTTRLRIEFSRNSNSDHKHL